MCIVLCVLGGVLVFAGDCGKKPEDENPKDPANAKPVVLEKGGKIQVKGDDGKPVDVELTDDMVAVLLKKKKVEGGVIDKSELIFAKTDEVQIDNGTDKKKYKVDDLLKGNIDVDVTVKKLTDGADMTVKLKDLVAKFNEYAGKAKSLGEAFDALVAGINTALLGGNATTLTTNGTYVWDQTAGRIFGSGGSVFSDDAKGVDNNGGELVFGEGGAKLKATCDALNTIKIAQMTARTTNWVD